MKFFFKYATKSEIISRSLFGKIQTDRAGPFHVDLHTSKDLKSSEFHF